MDDSISKALIMAAGVLIAVIVIGFVTLSFREIGLWAETSESESIVKQNTKFNKEYEVYDKDIMYGVDVISCLNKAFSNNEAIKGKYAEAIDASYAVAVEVEIKTTLTERIRIYHMNGAGKEVEYTNSDENPKNETRKAKDIFTVSSQYIESKISQLNLDRTFEHGYKETDVEPGIYSLTANTSDESTIIILLGLSNELRQTVKNTSANATQPDSWTRAVWETPLYDLKTRKFTCVGLEYSEQGRVNKIKFKEL